MVDSETFINLVAPFVGDLTFPVDLSEDLVREFRERGIPHEVATLRCGHYSSGKAPFKFIDGWILTRFLKRTLLSR